VGDETSGHSQDRFRAPVVAFERDDAGIGKITLEVENVANVGATPTVNRLVRIAYDTQVGLIDGQPVSDCILRHIGVLVLIDEDEAIARIELGAQFRIIAQGERRPE